MIVSRCTKSFRLTSLATAARLYCASNARGQQGLTDCLELVRLVLITTNAASKVTEIVEMSIHMNSISPYVRKEFWACLSDLSRKNHSSSSIWRSSRRNLLRIAVYSIQKRKGCCTYNTCLCEPPKAVRMHKPAGKPPMNSYVRCRMPMCRQVLGHVCTSPEACKGNVSLRS